MQAAGNGFRISSNEDGAIHSDGRLRFDATPAFAKKLDAVGSYYGDHGRARSAGSKE